MPGVNDLNNTVSGDPLLVNVAAGNYKLQPGSIAIDNAALPTEYEWFKPENQSCFRGICSWYLRASNSNSPSELLSQPDASEQIQPIDGNGDGIVEYDIGANEFDPAKP